MDKYNLETGKEYIYEVKEQDVEGYTSVVTGSVEDGFVVTNTKLDIDTTATKGVLKLNTDGTFATDDNGDYIIIEDEKLSYTLYEVGKTIWYELTVTNNSKYSGSTVVTDTLPTGLVYANDYRMMDNNTTFDTVNENENVITWNVNNMQSGETRKIYIKTTITDEALTGEYETININPDTDWWSTTGDPNKTRGTKTAQLYINLSGSILLNDSGESHATGYTGKVADVVLTVNDFNQSVDATYMPNTLAEYALLNSKIFSYVYSGPDLETIANAINNDSKAKAEGVTFDPETQMIVCYVLKGEDKNADGVPTTYHIDAVIRPKEKQQVSVYNVTNSVKIKDETKDETTIKVYEKPEISVKVVPTSSVTTQVPVAQRAILVLDFSSSMKGTKIEELKTAVNNFLDKFLSNGINEVMLIEYDKKIINNTPYGFTNDITALKNKLKKDKPDSGTNIDYGLTVANNYITKDNAKTTSVILMSDGAPYQYLDNKTNKVVSDQDKGASEAEESAGWIKDKGAKLYSIGFHLGSDEKELMSKIATEPNEPYYYETSSGADLSGAFENIATSITTTTDGKSISLSTNDGILTITKTGTNVDGEEEKSVFTEGQNVEIYTETYVANSSEPFKTYSWDEFKALEYVTYDDDLEKIEFDLRNYIKDTNGIDEDDTITIRFVNPVSESVVSAKMVSANVLSLAMGIVEDETTTNEIIANYEEKFNEVENSTVTENASEEETKTEQELQPVDNKDTEKSEKDVNTTSNTSNSTTSNKVEETNNTTVNSKVEENNDTKTDTIDSTVDDEDEKTGANSTSNETEENVQIPENDVTDQTIVKTENKDITNKVVEKEKVTTDSIETQTTEN